MHELRVAKHSSTTTKLWATTHSLRNGNLPASTSLGSSSPCETSESARKAKTTSPI